MCDFSLFIFAGSIHVGVLSMQEMLRSQIDTNFRDISIARTSILEAITIYQNRTLPNHVLHVNFQGEAGHDFDGLSREFFTILWQQINCTYLSDGHVPLVTPFGMGNNIPSETWVAIGRILSHGFIVSRHMPYQIATPTLFFILTGQMPPDEMLLNYFVEMLNGTDRALITEAREPSDLSRKLEIGYSFG